MMLKVVLFAAILACTMATYYGRGYNSKFASRIEFIRKSIRKTLDTYEDLYM